jgi:hypothetical protein
MEPGYGLAEPSFQVQTDRNSNLDALLRLLKHTGYFGFGLTNVTQVTILYPAQAQDNEMAPPSGAHSLRLCTAIRIVAG